MKVDAPDVGRDVASVGCRLLPAGFDIHFTCCGHTYGLQKAGKRTAIREDDFLVHCLAARLEVLPSSKKC